jgi:hypothetical protein
MKECKGAPPGKPVLWRVKHNDGTEAVVLAQTAYAAAQRAGWLMSECGDIEVRGEGTTCKKHPKYKAIREPVSTEKHPGGCNACWEQFNDKQR